MWFGVAPKNELPKRHHVFREEGLDYIFKNMLTILGSIAMIVIGKTYLTT